MILGHEAFGKLLQHEGGSLTNEIRKPWRAPTLPFCQQAMRNQYSAVPEPACPHLRPQPLDSGCAEATHLRWFIMASGAEPGMVVRGVAMEQTEL